MGPMARGTCERPVDGGGALGSRREIQSRAWSSSLTYEYCEGRLKDPLYGTIAPDSSLYYSFGIRYLKYTSKGHRASLTPIESSTCKDLGTRYHRVSFPSR